MDAIEKDLLLQIADLHGVPEGAYNIRQNGETQSRNTTANIDIVTKTDGKAGIDLWSFGNLIKVFEKMHEKTQGNILIISHQERILNIADKIVVIADGQIQNVGAKDDVLPKLLGTDACRVLTAKL